MCIGNRAIERNSKVHGIVIANALTVTLPKRVDRCVRKNALKILFPIYKRFPNSFVWTGVFNSDKSIPRLPQGRLLNFNRSRDAQQLISLPPFQPTTYLSDCAVMKINCFMTARCRRTRHGGRIGIVLTQSILARTRREFGVSLL